MKKSLGKIAAPTDSTRMEDEKETEWSKGPNGKETPPFPTSSLEDPFHKIMPAEPSHRQDASTSSQPSQMHTLAEHSPSLLLVEEPTDRDILFGRGGISNNHIGNRIFRTLVETRKAEYRGAIKHKRLAIAEGIYYAVAAKGGGRFLKKKNNGDGWHLVEGDQAIKKIKQALRESQHTNVMMSYEEIPDEFRYMFLRDEYDLIPLDLDVHTDLEAFDLSPMINL